MINVTYPGTFDPITKGHEDIIRRAASLFPKIIVAVAESKKKGTLFTLDERIRLAKEVTKDISNVEVQGFSGLLVDFIKTHHSACIIRGARAVSDFEYEFQMAGMNLMLMPNVDTIFLTPAVQYQFVSGTFVREIGLMGGELDDFVSPPVKEALIRKRLERQHHKTQKD
ncbi:MAG: pantetheine-phosphate adenylyltransferase [Burkholderiales bacterium]|nr:pantetheine-phosphate adenylyltransferase [Burkholderiales bacterium]